MTSVEGSIREGFRAVLAAISGLHAYSEQPDALVPLACWPIPERQGSALTFGGADKVSTFNVYLIAVPTTMQAAQQQLAPYISPTGTQSVEAALYAAPTLSGACLGILAIQLQHYGGFPRDSALAAYIGAIWSVDLLVG